MEWMPPLTWTLSVIKELEKETDDMVHSSRLFWLFFNHILSPEEFRLDIIKKNELLQNKTIIFDNSDTENVFYQALNNPDKVAHALSTRLDSIASRKRSLITSSSNNEHVLLFTLIHIEAARLIRKIKTEGRSENTLELLNDLFELFSRCESTLHVPYDTFPKYLLASLESIGAFLLVSQFEIMKSTARFEEALTFFLEGSDHIIQSYLLIAHEDNFVSKDRLDANGNIPDIEYHIIEVKSGIRSFIPNPAHPFLKIVNSKQISWIDKFTPQAAVDCFEKIKLDNRIKSPKSLTAISNRLIELFRKELRWLWGDNIRIKDLNDYTWDPEVYWYSAIEWINGHLNPSELRELLQETEDKGAEKRLQTYFFRQDLWNVIPKRAKLSLINADRVWFGGKNIRTEAVLNELRNATEEILLYGCWIPLNIWLKSKNNISPKAQAFLSNKNKLEQKHKNPGLFDYENLLKLEIFADFLSDSGITHGWLINELPNYIKSLRNRRAEAEHDSKTVWEREEIEVFYNRFLGIGQSGVIPKLVMLIFNNLELGKK